MGQLVGVVKVDDIGLASRVGVALEHHRARRVGLARGIGERGHLLLGALHGRGAGVQQLVVRGPDDNGGMIALRLDEGREVIVRVLPELVPESV